MWGGEGGGGFVDGVTNLAFVTVPVVRNRNRSLSILHSNKNLERRWISGGGKLDPA